MAAKRKKGGAAFPAKLKENNGSREPGTFRKLDSAAKVSSLGTKTSSDGFKKGGATKRAEGGSIQGAASTPSLTKRARGGRTTAPFSAVHVPTDRGGKSESGHEGEGG